MTRSTPRWSWLACLATLLSLAVPTAAQAIDPPTHVKTWGSPGSGPGRFSFPSDIAADGKGALYVTDTNNHRIQKFNTNGVWQTQWGGLGTTQPNPQDPFQVLDKFSSPRGIEVDRDGNPVIADTANNRVKITDGTGNLLKLWGGWPLSPVPGKFEINQSVAVDMFGNIYVWDRWERIQRFTPEGSFVLQWFTPPGFGLAHGEIQADRNGNILFTSCDGNKVIRFSPFGGIINQWGTPGSGPGRFNCPRGLAVDRNNNTYVTDSGNKRIQVFGPDNKFLLSWNGTQTPGGKFGRPDGIAVDAKDVYVTDGDLDRISKFTFPKLP